MLYVVAWTSTRMQHEKVEAAANSAILSVPPSLSPPLSPLSLPTSVSAAGSDEAVEFFTVLAPSPTAAVASATTAVVAGGF